MKKTIFNIPLFFLYLFSLPAFSEVIFLDCKGKTEADHTVRVHSGKKDKENFKVFDEMPVYENLPVEFESYTYALDQTKNSLYENNNKFLAIINQCTYILTYLYWMLDMYVCTYQ